MKWDLSTIEEIEADNILDAELEASKLVYPNS